MRKIQTLIIFTVFTLTCYSQDKISSYKNEADKIILNYFDKSLIPKIRCTDVAIDGLDSSITYFLTYAQAKNERKKFSKINFYYSYFSTTLKYNFEFQITVDQNKKVIFDSSIFDQIPDCISKTFNCIFINKDSAIQIAVKDSIPYPNNLSAILTKNHKNDNYFWFVTGRPKEKKTNYRKTTSRKLLSSQQRIINALTGKLIPYNEYFNN